MTSVILINYRSSVIPSATVGRVDRRFVAAAVVLPGGLAILAGPTLSALARLSGHEVKNGAVTLNALIAAVVGAGGFITATLIFLCSASPSRKRRWSGVY